MIPKKAIKKIKNEAHVEIAVGTLIAYRVFPSTNEGIQKAKNTIAGREDWLAPSNLPEYYDNIDSDLLTGKETPGIISIRNSLKEFYGLSSAGTQEFVDTQVYIPADKFIDDNKEFVIDKEKDLKDALEETSNNITDAIDDILRKDQEKFEEFKAKEAEELKKRIEKINKPERVAEELTIKIPPAHYIQGQSGRWQPEFENDIDHAIYFAGKSPLPKGAKQREVLDWLKSLGLTYQQIHDHREKVLEQIQETISLPGVEEEYPYVYIDAVDQDFVLDADEEEFDEIEDDLEGLDDLLNLVRTDDDTSEKEVVENIEEEIVDAAEEDDEDEGDIGSEDDIPDELLQDEVDPKLLEKLLVTINKPKKESSYTSNKKIFDAVISNFGRIQSTLDTVNRNLENQNELIKASIETQLAVGELITNQTNILEDKFGLILQQFQAQANVAEQQNEALESKSAEDKLEAQRDAAGVADYQDLTKKPQKKKRENKIEKFLKSRLTKKLYRKLPKSVRKARQRVRKLQRLPGKAKAKAVNKITSLLPSKGKQAVGALSKIRGAGSLGKLTGPARYAFAGLEYSERKAEGQSEIQALSGVGGGLAGAAAGAKAGALFGGKVGLLLGPKGAAVGAIIGGLLGSIVGGVKGSEAVDSFTGAEQVTGEHETGTGLTKPGTAILHGTEAVIPDASLDMSPMSTLGGVMLAATSQYINSAGAVAAPIAPTFKGIAGQMAKEYDVPSTVTQTNVGGSLPQLDKELRKVKEKRTGTPEEEFTGKEKDLLDTQNEESFAEKLLSMLDPEGKLERLLRSINLGGDGGAGEEMDLNLIGDGAFDTGLRTGPSGVIGGSADYHQDLSFGPNVSMEDKRKLVLQMATAYDKVGRKLELSNAGVGGRVFPVNGTKEEQIKWIKDAEAAHRARNGGTGRNAIDFYTPLKSQDRFGKSVENTPMLAPTIEGAETRYFSGGGAGAGVSIVKDGIEILKLIHGRTDIALPNGGRIPSTIASPTSPVQQQAASGKIIRSFKVGNFVYTEREGGVYTQNGKPISKESFDAVVKNHPSVAQASISSPQQSQQNLASSISAPPQRQRTVERTMEIASLSYDNSEQSNDMMIINNQQPQMPSMPANQTPMMFNASGKTSSELMKDLMLQRLTA